MVVFAYVGIEMIGLSAGEAENPEKTIPMAIDSLAWRILIFYGGALFVILSIFPWNEVGNQGSPFVAMFERIGLREAAGIINFVVITAALSSCNAGIFSGGRLLYGLSLNGYAPKSLGKISSTGVPSKAVVVTVLVPMIGVLLNYLVPEKAFQWVTAAVTLIGLLVWVAILVTQLMFRKTLSKSQVEKLSYTSVWWPFASWIALVFIGLVIVLMSFHEQTRVSLFVGPPILIILVLIYYICGLHRRHSQQGEKL